MIYLFYYLEKISSLSELFFLFFAHAVWLRSVRLGAVEREVVTFKVAIHGEEGLDDESFDFSSFFEVGNWGELESSDGSSSSASASEHVFAGGVDLGVSKFGDIKVGGVLGVRGVATVSCRDDGLEKLGEELVGLLISGDETDSLDHGMT